MIAVLQAAKEGKTIQFRIANDDKDRWKDAKCPNWDFSSYDYRVKPEPNLRPYANASEFLADMKEHGGSVHTKKGYNDIPVRVLGCGIVIIDFELNKKHDYKYVFIPYSKLLKNFRFLDETPCGIEE